MATGKTIALTIWTFVGKVTSLLFNTLSRFVMSFLSSSKHLSVTGNERSGKLGNLARVSL